MCYYKANINLNRLSITLAIIRWWKSRTSIEFKFARKEHNELIENINDMYGESTFRKKKKTTQIRISRRLMKKRPLCHQNANWLPPNDVLHLPSVPSYLAVPSSLIHSRPFFVVIYPREKSHLMTTKYSSPEQLRLLLPPWLPRPSYRDG